MNQTTSEMEEQVTLTCDALGDPTPSINWSYGVQVFNEGEQVMPSGASAPLARLQYKQLQRSRAAGSRFVDAAEGTATLFMYTLLLNITRVH